MLVVFYRDHDGKVNALHDRCPHRFAPLSKGCVKEGVIHCGYHGLGFSGDGICVTNPYGQTGNLKVMSYSVREKCHGVWIWMGDPQQCEAVDIPDLSLFSGVTSSACSTGYRAAKGSSWSWTSRMPAPGLAAEVRANRTSPTRSVPVNRVQA